MNDKYEFTGEAELASNFKAAYTAVAAANAALILLMDSILAYETLGYIDNSDIFEEADAACSIIDAAVSDTDAMIDNILTAENYVFSLNQARTRSE